MEKWRNGEMEKWSIGVLECWVQDDPIYLILEGGIFQAGVGVLRVGHKLTKK
jgi:hypothetical protein